MEPIRPSVCRNARPKTARSVSAVVIARAEYGGCPPGVVRASACHAAIAASVNQTLRLPRCRKAASYSGPFVTLLANYSVGVESSGFSIAGRSAVVIGDAVEEDCHVPATPAYGADP
jgi:hypothetical protein